MQASPRQMLIRDSDIVCGTVLARNAMNQKIQQRGERPLRREGRGSRQLMSGPAMRVSRGFRLTRTISSVYLPRQLFPRISRGLLGFRRNGGLKGSFVPEKASEGHRQKRALSRARDLSPTYPHPEVLFFPFLSLSPSSSLLASQVVSIRAAHNAVSDHKFHSRS